MRSMKILGLVATAGLLLGAVGAASANEISAYLSNGNSAINSYPAPYGSVDINLTDSQHATITFQSYNVGGYAYLMGDGGTVALNVNATTFSVGTVNETNSWAGFTPTFKDLASGNEDGFGSFNLQIDNKGAYTQSATTVSFVLTNVSGTWSNASDVLTPNALSGGFEAAAHIFVTNYPANVSATALSTGYAANGEFTPGPPQPPSPIPEPSTMILWAGFGMGLGFWGVWSRRRQSLAVEA